MKLTSVRARLTLWNIGAVALALAGFAVAVWYTVEARLITTIDGDLTRQAVQMADSFARLDVMQSNPRFKGDRQRRIQSLIQQLRALDLSLPRPGRMGLHMLRVLDLSGHLVPAPPRFAGLLLDGKGVPVRPSGGKALSVLPRRSAPANEGDENQPFDDRLFTQSAAGEAGYSTFRVNGTNLRVYSRPLLRDGRVVGVVQVAHPLTELRSLMNGLAWTMLTLVPLALLGAGFIGAFMTERALRPVRRITSAAEAVGAQDLSRRLPVTGGDEFAELAATFNRMIGRLQTAFTGLESAIEQQRRFTADASHELRTPLTTIKANTSLALRGKRTREEYQAALSAADQAADMMNRMVLDLLLLARSDSGQMDLKREPVCVLEVLDRALSLARRGPENATLCLDDIDPDLEVIGDSDHVVRLFVNLVENALRHTPAEGSVRLAACAEGKQVVLTVEDTGEGIPPEHLAHVCERFYRVDAARARTDGGTGLGLAICKSIVEAHGGTLQLQSVVGTGTTVTVTLPRYEPPVEMRPVESHVKGLASAG